MPEPSGKGLGRWLATRKRRSVEAAYMPSHLLFRTLGGPFLVIGLLAPFLAHAGRLPSGGESPTNAGAAPHVQPAEGTFARERKSDDAISRSERDFMTRAAEAGLLQVRAARLVVVRSRSPVVKKIATGYVMDHTASLAELTRMANRWRIELPIAAPRLTTMRRHLDEARDAASGRMGD